MTSAEHENAAGAGRLALLVKWLLLCAGKLCEDAPTITLAALQEQVHDMFAKLLTADDPDIRAAAVFSLGALIQAHEGDATAEEFTEGGQAAAPLLEQDRMVLERAIVCGLLEVVYDASPLVR
jgi:regulatory associated protein of mTOR